MQITVVNKEVELSSIRVWLQESYNTFKVAKITFILFAIISTFIGAIPLIGAFMLPLFTAKYAEISSKIEKEEDVSFVEFFIGLFSNKSIILVGVFHLIAFIIAFFLKFTLMKEHDPSTISGDVLKLIFTLIAMIAIFIFMLAFWLAPIICLKNPDVKAFNSLMLSLSAFKSHVGKIIKFGGFIMLLGALVIGGLIGAAVIIQHLGYHMLAFIPGVLGVLLMFAWIPILHISAYFIYKSLFLIYNES